MPSSWEQRKLGECGEINPDAMLPDSFEYVDLESVVGTELIGHRREKRSTAPSRAQRLAKLGDIFYQTVRPYQKNNYLYKLPDRDYVFSTGYAQIRSSIDSGFLFCLLQRDTFVEDVLDRCTGTSYPAINANDLADIEVYVSTGQDEQCQIGALFSQLDNLITLHQRKYEKLSVLKKSLLEKMFPREGENKPEVRFAGFTDPWEQRKLGEVVGNIATGKLDANAAIENGIYPFFTTAVQTYRTNTYSFDADAILVAGNGPIGFIKEYCGKFDAYQREYVITGFSDNVKSFIAAAMKRAMPARIATATYGSAMPYITLDVLSEMTLSLPTTKEEQRRVAIVVNVLDNLITLHQRKSALQNRLKRGWLKIALPDQHLYFQALE